MLSTDVDIPPEFSRPEVVAILREYYASHDSTGLDLSIMIIAQISDTHIALDSPDADQRIRDFELTIADINALDPAPDVIVHTGDIVHNGRRRRIRSGRGHTREGPCTGLRLGRQ